MSVAFRREGDDEHKEPRFELPIPPGPNLVTARGARLVARRIAELSEEVAVRTGEADADGTPLHRLRRELRYWHTRQATAEPTPPPADGTAGFGTRVTLRMNRRIRHIAIVGADEADPASDRLAFSAPLARALAGAEVGEHVDFGGVPNALEILAVAPLDAAD